MINIHFLLIHTIFIFHCIQIAVCKTFQKSQKISCPNYGSVSHGLLCLGLNKVKSIRTESWIRCANECIKHHDHSRYRKCKYWSWRVTDLSCTLKTKSSRCLTRDDSFISGSMPTSMVGYCSTTCVVGEWSDWSFCTYSRPCGGYSERTRHVIFSPIFPGEICPNKSELKSCKLDNSRCPSNCPDTGIITLGWGCSAFKMSGGGSIAIPNIDKEKCKEECKNNDECVSWSHGPWDQSIEERNSFPRLNSVSFDEGIHVCIVVLNYIGCSFKKEGWITGNTETNLSDNTCSIDCVTSMWSNWSFCSLDKNDGQYYRKRYRSIITRDNKMGLGCPDLQESSLCENNTNIENNNF
ncbi:TSP1 domain-containing protein TSP5 precursor [Cryptosporidium ryanae]|uniref:TSP1 domain-containing protein TSP5 precursor n=1 Tax=Cryptosporidium ryanae TaxID=515981 RepID=UPI003519F28F|nr:TSP1 domain-containing protein TSP5 precursor [Cryptosporidium ryanae]